MLEEALAGRVFVVTGATSGIGRATARALAARGATVGLVGRSAHRLEATAEDVDAASEHAVAYTFRADLSRVSDNRRVAVEIADALGTIDVLVNNVGAVFPEFGRTEEGVERTLALNHLGPLTLTRALLPALRASPNPRVVSVSSQVHARTLDLDTVESDVGYDGLRAYGVSKLLNLLMIRHLHRTEGAWLTTAGLHPGVVDTSLLADYDRAAALRETAAQAERDRARGMTRRLAGRLARALRPATPFSSVGVTTSEGSATSVFVATDPAIDDAPGAYWKDCALAEPAPIVGDDAVVDAAWEWSVARTDAIGVQGPA